MIQCGIDRIDQHAQLYAGKRLGLITTPTGRNSEMRSTIELLHERFHLAALFSPEHGVRGDLAAGAIVDTYTDQQTGVPVYSLYRQDSKRLTPEMLAEVDMVIYDIQDVGVRYYTFIYTMLYALEDCAKAGKPLVVLDRPNPLNGLTVEGNVLKEEYRSFVGNYPLAVRYGLTAGELAAMVNDQMNWNAELYVMRCVNWERSSMFPETKMTWIPPSLGMPRFDTTLLYSGTCLFEGTNVSEGRGTTLPFEMIGAPFIDGERLSMEMNRLNLPGVMFRSTYFVPTASKHQGIRCSGVQIHITDGHSVRAVEVGVHLLNMIKSNYEAFDFLPPVRENGRCFIDLLAGDQLYRHASLDVPALLEQFEEESRQFAAAKEKYHLYG